MWFNLGVSFVFMFFFRGWGTLAAVISVATVISFLTGPVSVMALRTHAADLPRPLRIAGMPIVAPFAFVCASLVLYWACWPLTGQIILLIVAALPIYLYYQSKSGWADFRAELRSAWWLLAYLPVMALLSLCGEQAFGGYGIIPDGWDLFAVVIVALAFYRRGVASGRRTTYLREYATVQRAGSAEDDTPLPVTHAG
ncbi:hypothetical protein GEM_3316 [Burkholderia cepacia GG4]|uniref:Amino acid permease-associated region n=1 Tax=Burkholderia cepacia GG4 TaxID=1009846 RepID=A0A9W3K2B8_BURCE|nr:hypothetical protein GEM_3316 [Burkholderia cepacia GG4]